MTIKLDSGSKRATAFWMEGHRCAVCRAPAQSACFACRSVYYCSKACQRHDWPAHLQAGCLHESKALNVFDVALANTELHKDDVLSEPTRLNVSVSHVAAGAQLTLETHHYLSQALLVLTGHGEVRQGASKTCLEPGSMVLIQQGAAHEVLANRGEALKLISVYAKDVAAQEWNHG